MSARLTTREKIARHVAVDPASGCWVWAGDRVAGGYGRTRVDGVKTLAHRASWAEFRGPIPPGMVVMHICDNPPCCNPEHLRIGTEAENIADRQRKGRQARGDGHARLRGSANGASSLDETAVAAIRARYAAGGISQRALGELFGVKQMAISTIVRRKTWRHVP